MSEVKKANNATPKAEEKTPSTESVLKTELSKAEGKQEPNLSQMEAKRPDVSEKAERHKYFIGLTPDCFKSSLTIGGHSFPVFTCVTGKDQSGQDVEMPQRGGIRDLSDSEVDMIKAAVIRKGIRLVGDSITTFFPEGGRYQKNEFPSAMFVYLHKIDDLVKAFPLNWRESAEIPTMMSRDSYTSELFGNGWKTPNGEAIPLIKPQDVDKIVKKEY